jgi:hypothetical protein
MKTYLALALVLWIGAAALSDFAGREEPTFARAVFYVK